MTWWEVLSGHRPKEKHNMAKGWNINLNDPEVIKTMEASRDYLLKNHMGHQFIGEPVNTNHEKEKVEKCLIMTN